MQTESSSALTCSHRLTCIASIIGSWRQPMNTSSTQRTPHARAVGTFMVLAFPPRSCKRFIERMPSSCCLPADAEVRSQGRVRIADCSATYWSERGQRRRSSSSRPETLRRELIIGHRKRTDSLDRDSESKGRIRGEHGCLILLQCSCQGSPRSDCGFKGYSVLARLEWIFGPASIAEP